MLIFNAIGQILNALVKYWYLTTAALIIALIIYLYAGWTRAERIATEAVGTSDAITVDATKTNANIAANASANARRQTEATRHADFANTSLSEAERLRCEAFPKSCGQMSVANGVLKNQ